MKELAFTLALVAAYLIINLSTTQAQTNIHKEINTTTNSGGGNDSGGGSDSDFLGGGGNTGQIGSGASAGSGSSNGVWNSSGNCACHDSLGAILGVGHTSHGNGNGYGHWLYGQCMQLGITCNCPPQ